MHSHNFRRKRKKIRKFQDRKKGKHHPSTGVPKQHKVTDYSILFGLTYDFNWRIKVIQRNQQSTLSKDGGRLTIDYDDKVVTTKGYQLSELERVFINHKGFQIQ